MKKFIIKAQRSLAPETNTILIYDKKRRFFQELPDEGGISEIMGVQLKVYLLVHIDSKGILHIHKQIKEQNW